MTSEHAFSGPGADGWHIGPAFGPAVLVGTLAVPSAVAAWFNGLPWSLRAAVLLLVVVLAARAIKRLLRPQIIRIKISGPTVWFKSARHGPGAGTIVGTSFVSPFYTGFSWTGQQGRRRRGFGVFRAQMNERDYRHLCVALRMEQVH
ncbi:MAG TPA: protein YgfX [Wenzhouxiangella sp.]|nr:protein YgfX [Wenzhouxiangella sp.]